MRRLSRDTMERGRSTQDVIDQFLTTVRPMHELYVEPSKRVADIIVPSHQDSKRGYTMALSLVCNHLRVEAGLLPTRDTGES
jgi:uridine kinase